MGASSQSQLQRGRDQRPKTIYWLLLAGRRTGLERAWYGSLDERDDRADDEECNDGWREHGHRPRTAGHREDRRERQAGVAKLRVQTGVILRLTRMTGCMQQRTGLGHEQGQAQRDARQQSWCARQLAIVRRTTGIVGRSRDYGNPGDVLDMPPSGVILHQRMRRFLVRLFTELRRRKVIQTAVLYAVSAWVLLQVAELLLEMLEVPPWGLKLVFVLLLIGFPLALLLSWLNQVTPEGIRRETAAPEPPRGLPPAHAFAPHASDSPPSETASPETAADQRSIAVLPFANLSEDKANEYFADGLSEELLNLLSRIKELRVVARTSSFSFKAELSAPPRSHASSRSPISSKAVCAGPVRGYASPRS